MLFQCSGDGRLRTKIVVSRAFDRPVCLIMTDLAASGQTCQPDSEASLTKELCSLGCADGSFNQSSQYPGNVIQRGIVPSYLGGK